MKKISGFCLALLTSLFLASCSTTHEPSEAYKGESPEHIFEAGRASLIDQNYGDSIKRFEALDVQYPFGANTERAQFYIIYAYYMKQEYALSVAAADRFIQTHPAYPHLDYIYYIRGLAEYSQTLGTIERLFKVDLATRDLTQVRKAYVDFAALIQRFPDSPYAPSAYQYMIYLRNTMANHELETAHYYYDRGAYMAAVNRASNVVTQFQESPAVTDALVVMVKSYRQLHLTQLEQDTLKVLQANDPNVRVD